MPSRIFSRTSIGDGVLLTLRLAGPRDSCWISASVHCSLRSFVFVLV